MKYKLLSRKTWWLGFIIFLTLGLRLIPIWGGAFPFMYDHARDSLAIWEMAALKKPALIGAQTSIPGLYYGPAWYYLALPLNIILSFHPLASVLTTILLATLAVVLAARSFDKVTALLLAGSIGLVAAQQSGWSPYLTSITSIIILALVKRLIANQGKQRFWLMSAIVGTLALSFHFQPAFAIVQLPLVLFTLRVEISKYAWKQWLVFAAVFATPFLPQVLFELRHNFHQTTQLWNFIVNYQAQAARIGENSTGLVRVIEIGRYIVDSATSALPIAIPYSGILLVGFLGWRLQQSQKKTGKRKSRDTVFTLSWFMVIGTFLLYLFLPAKAYYFVGLTPYWVYILAVAVRRLRWQPKYSLGMIVLTILIQFGFGLHTRQSQLRTRNTYAPKQAVIMKIAALAQGEPFVAYHYVPELYDYTYQVLHFREMRKNPHYRPVEISYEPHKGLYLDEYSTQNWAPPTSTEPSKHTYLVVEADERRQLYDVWWQRLTTGYMVQHTYTINPEITIYELEPRTN